MIFKKQKKAMQTLGILLLTISPLWAEGGVLGWIEGKSTQSTNNPCAQFPGTRLYPGTAHTCYKCPEKVTFTGTEQSPACSVSETKLNACKNEGGVRGKGNVCIYCPSGQYNGVACI
ncbi:MAG: hypothetical protein HYX35_04685 [Proteobacteria bacterium]|nr:hypothetical protein [Pseudomonadota bacterium]